MKKLHLPSAPSWKTFIAIVLGVCAMIGAYKISLFEEREGFQAASITVVDENQHFDRNALVSALETVYFGRDVHVLVYIGDSPETSTNETGWNHIEYLSDAFPAYFTDYGPPRTQSLVLWLNPTLKTGDIAIGDVPSSSYASYSLEHDASDALTFEYLQNKLTPARIAHIVQALADEEAGVNSANARTTRVAMSIAAGLVVAILAYLALSGVMQARAHYRNAGSLRSLSRKERRTRLEHAREVFVTASHDIDEHTPAWQRAYTQLARSMFGASGLSDRELTSLTHAPVLEELIASAQALEDDFSNDSAWDELTQKDPRARTPIQLTHLHTGLSSRFNDVAKDGASQRGFSLSRLPIAPITVIIAALLALAIGAAYASLSAPTQSHLTQSDALYRTMPTSIDPDAATIGIPILRSDNVESLQGFEHVEIIDNAHIFADTDALRDMVAHIPIPVDISLRIVTTETKLSDVDAYSVDERALADEFPQYFERFDFDTPIARHRVDNGENSITLVYADAGNQRILFEAVDLELTFNQSYLSRQEWNPYSEFSDGHGSPTATLWNTLAAESNLIRGVEISTPTNTLRSGTTSVRNGVIAGLIAFPVLLLLTALALTPLRRSRARSSARKEITQTMTAISLGHDALMLEAVSLEKQHPDYHCTTRFETWARMYEHAHEIVRTTFEREVLEQTSTSGNSERELVTLADQLAVTRLLRLQTESLWRIRIILDTAPLWEEYLADEIALLGVFTNAYGSKQKSGADKESSAQAAEHFINAWSEHWNDAHAAEQGRGLALLRLLDAQARKSDHAALWRCLSSEECDSLQYLAASTKAEQCGAFALLSNPRAGSGAKSLIARESVQSITKGYVPSFFSLDTSVISWIGAVCTAIARTLWKQHKKRVAKRREKYRRRAATQKNRQNPVRYAVNTLIRQGATLVGSLLAIIIGIGFIGTIFAESTDEELLSKSALTSYRPLSVTVDDPNNLIDDEAIATAAQQINLGAPIHLLITAHADDCWSHFDTLQPHTTELKKLIYRYEPDATRLHYGVQVICAQSNRVESRENYPLIVANSYGDYCFHEQTGATLSQDSRHLSDNFLAWLNERVKTQEPLNRLELLVDESSAQQLGLAAE